MRLHNRQIKACFWEDPDLLRLPRDARILFEGLWALADDSGCLYDDPFLFKVRLFPSPLDADLTPNRLGELRDALVSAGMLIPYSSGGKQCLYITNFHRHQHLQNPGAPTVPLPPWIKWQASENRYRGGTYIVGKPTITAQSQHSDSTVTDQSGTKNLEPRNLEPRNLEPRTFPQPPNNLGMGIGSDGEGVGGPSSEELLASTAESLHTLSQPPIDDKATDENLHSDLPAGITQSHDASPTERSILRELRQVRGYPFDWQRDLESIRLIATDFPCLDLVHEARRWRTYKLDKPLRPNSNARLQFRNWCRIAAERQHRHPRDSPGVDLASIARDAEEQIEYTRRLKERSHGPG